MELKVLWYITYKYKYPFEHTNDTDTDISNCPTNVRNDLEDVNTKSCRGNDGAAVTWK